MKQTLRFSGVAGVLFALAGAVQAQPAQLPEPLQSQGFENTPETWLGLGDGGIVTVDHTPENVKVGAGSLRFDYEVEPGELNLLVSPLAPQSLNTLASISFWIKADHNASLIFALQEDGGGRFGTFFTIPKNQWQRVEIAPSELVLQTGGKDDPKDDDGKLDFSKVNGVALLDLNQMLAADPQSPLVKVLGVETGARTLFLDDLTFSSKPTTTRPQDKTVIDDFAQPQVAWASVGQVTLKAIKYDPPKPETNTLEAAYTQTAGRAAAIIKPLRAGVLAQKTALTLDIASKQSALVLVQLEEIGGGKYNSVLMLTPGTELTTKTLPFAEFKRADDSKDNKNQLDLDQVKQLLILDSSGILGMGAGDNTLRLGTIRVK